MAIRSKVSPKIVDFIDDVSEMKNNLTKNVNMIKKPMRFTERKGMYNKFESFLGKYINVKDFDKRSKEGFDNIFKDFDFMKNKNMK